MREGQLQVGCAAGLVLTSMQEGELHADGLFGSMQTDMRWQTIAP